MTIKKLVMLESCLNFFVRMGNIGFAGAKRAETANYFSANPTWHPVSTTLVSSKMNTTCTETFTSEWVLFDQLIIRMWDVATVCCSPAFIILRLLISRKTERLATGE